MRFIFYKLRQVQFKCFLAKCLICYDKHHRMFGTDAHMRERYEYIKIFSI